MNKTPIANQLQSSIELAKKIALSIGRNGVEPDVLLYALLTNPSLGFVDIVQKSDIDIDHLTNLALADLEKKKPTKSPSDHLTEKTKRLLESAEILSKENFKLDYISSETVFLCFFTKDFVTKALKSFFEFDDVDDCFSKENVQKLFAATSIYLTDYQEEPIEQQLEEISGEGNYSNEFLDMYQDNPILSEFAENLNIKAAQGNFEQIVDFDSKINELAAILCRKKKPNAILVGGGGVGKSSIVESLALMIVRGEAPELLANKVIFSLNLSSMVAGTMFRGQFEERLKNFVNEIKKYNNIILFIDEIHTLVGAGGGSSSSLEASNALKPELARGTISCIGATTINEYTQTIKKDAALDRRFERVLVREPSKFIMKEILPTILSNYEDFHGVEYSEEFIDNVVEFCERFLPNKLYPDKAVTVIDHCGAQAKVNFWETDDSIKETHQKILNNLNDKGKVEPELFEDLNKKLELWQERLIQEKPIVTLQHLRDFFDKKKNPLSNIEVCEEVSSYIKKEFVGQKKVINEFFRSIEKSSIGLGKRVSNASPDTYLFYGNKSSGKTLLSKTIKDGLEKSGASVIYYNGSQLSDPYAQYKILSEQSTNTSLCERVVMDPNCVIIIDDFQNIDPRCESLFLQIMKEGKLQMSNGDLADFSNCKFIITCNSSKKSSMGFNSNNEQDSPNLKQEVLDLVEKCLFLSNPSIVDLRRIVFNKLKQIKLNLFLQNIDFNFDFKFIKKFVDENKCEENCVESLSFAIEDKIINIISDKIQKGETQISL